MLEELLALSQAGQRLVRLADLSEDPSGAGDRAGEVEEGPPPERRDPVLEQ
jgi:hypothetical protein